MFRSSNFDKTLEVATSHLLLEPDWPSILLICDSIRQNDVSPKHAFQAIKKKMTSPNPHTAYYALLVLESIVKNCGAPMHEEVSTKENCEMFSNFIEQTPHDNVRAKMLELVQTWAYAFRTSDKYQAIKDTMTILKAKGHSFPELKEADAMFAADSAPDWADGKVCHRCRVEFSFTVRKHHCRNCGQIFCGQCSSKQCTLPKFGIEKEVRVCDGCYAQLQKPTSLKSKNSTESELPVEYLNSSLAQQSQTPQRKSEQELKEEEELQLALALSQSEAEAKNKSPTPNYRIFQKSSSPEPSSPLQSPSSALSVEETPSDPELAKYLNRSYWEHRKMTSSDSPASPSAPSPMPQANLTLIKMVPEDAEIDEFAQNMKSQVEIFVNRMKSNSSRGRNIANDSSVQTLFMNITSLHSRLLSYIKDMDDKRMWYEQLQDKLAQVKDSRAALDVLRQEHIEKLRRIAEEQERQRQLQMAHKLEIMRKKKQEYLQYQRQLALQRIQEQEREMQMRQEQQKAQYRISQTTFPFIPGQSNSPQHQMQISQYGYGANSSNIATRFGPQGQMIASPVIMPGMYSPGMPTATISAAIVGMPSNNVNLQPNQQQQISAQQTQVSHGISSVQNSHLPVTIARQPELPQQFTTSEPPLNASNVGMGMAGIPSVVPSDATSSNSVITSAPVSGSPQQLVAQAAGDLQQQKTPLSSQQQQAVQTINSLLPQATVEDKGNEVQTAELISFD